MRLAGRVALVTGAGDGIGRAAALLLAAEGARVAALDVREAAVDETARLVRRAGGEALGVVADVSDDAAVARAVASATGAYDALHVLVCCAGIWLPEDGSVTDLPLEVWHRTLAVNVTGTFLTLRHGIPALVAAGGGSIVCVGSPVADRPEAVYDAYTASKGAIPALARSIAQHYGPRGVRANVVLPGATTTGMTRGAFAVDEYREAALRHTPIGRLGEPEDIARGILYLACDESAFVTGATLAIDGGWLVAE
jgi:NAD(P)-dependent dehydrogenase (short-subunit alcohol dehydrogenase family)